MRIQLVKVIIVLDRYRGIVTVGCKFYSTTETSQTDWCTCKNNNRVEV